MNDLHFARPKAYYHLDPRYRELNGPIGFDKTFLLRCRIDLLMVTDGASFEDGSGYNLSEVIGSIQDDLPWYVSINIKTAEHHSGSASGADYPNFAFDDHDLHQYDQIWIVAVGSSGALADSEVAAIWDFMQNGGGIFATGDHAALGVRLCGKIPRVRNMRRWYYPNPGPNGEPVAPGGVGTNHNTTVGMGEFDGLVQEIYPKFYQANYPFILLKRNFPHRVLCGPLGPITVLPDHMHEGHIEVPPLNMPIQVNGANVKEYPNAGGSQLAPEVIARATNHETGNQFGVIGAYDGHRVDEISGGVGRIIVDATWHHLFNLNLNQLRYPYERVQSALAAGLLPDPADVPLANQYRQVRAYFQNTAIWLARKSTQRCIHRRGLWFLRGHVDIIMALNSFHERFWYFLDLGTKARDAFGRLAPQCEFLSLVYDIILPQEYHRFLEPWVPIIKNIEEEIAPSLVDPEVIELTAIGGALHELYQRFDEKIGEDLLDSEKFDNLVQEGSRSALKTLVKTLGQNRAFIEKRL